MPRAMTPAEVQTRAEKEWMAATHKTTGEATNHTRFLKKYTRWERTMNASMTLLLLAGPSIGMGAMAFFVMGWVKQAVSL